MPSSAASQRSCRSLPRNSRSRSTVVTLMVRPWIASEGTPPCTRIGEEIVGELRRRAFSRVTPTKVGAHIPETGVYGPPRLTNEVQHQVKVLRWENIMITSRLKTGARLPAFMKAGNRFGKSRQLWIARHRQCLAS